MFKKILFTIVLPIALAACSGSDAENFLQPNRGQGTGSEIKNQKIQGLIFSEQVQIEFARFDSFGENSEEVVLDLYKETKQEVCSGSMIQPVASVVLPRLQAGVYTFSEMGGNGNPLVFQTGNSNSMAAVTEVQLSAPVNGVWTVALKADAENPAENRLEGRIEILDCSAPTPNPVPAPSFEAKAFGEKLNVKHIVYGSPFWPEYGRTYWEVSLFEQTPHEPCSERHYAPKAISFYLPKSGTLGSHDMSKTMGNYYGVKFKKISGFQSDIDFIDRGQIRVKSIGVDKSLMIEAQMNPTESHTLQGSFQATFCP